MEQKEYTERYKPLSPWAYVGLNVLFSIPVVGFVFLIVYTFSGANINRRNYARSFWCMALISLAVFLLLCVCGFLMGYTWQDVAQIVRR